MAIFGSACRPSSHPRTGAVSIKASVMLMAKLQENAEIGVYRLRYLLGRGGMADVWYAEKRREAGRGKSGFVKPVALKVMHPQLAASSPDFSRRFLDEARVGALLTGSQHIVQTNDVGIWENERLWIEMEYVPGWTLGKLLEELRSRHAAIPVSVALQIINQIAQGLAFAHGCDSHEGRSLKFVHRDLKPSNILITPEGVVKIADFGIAKAAGNNAVTKRGFVVGTLRYMAPEQAEGEELDHRADLFSLAVILFETLTMEPLYNGRVDMQVLQMAAEAKVEQRLTRLPQCPRRKELVHFLRRALAKERGKRFQSAHELQAELYKLIDSDSLPLLQWIKREGLCGSGTQERTKQKAGEKKPARRIVSLSGTAQGDATKILPDASSSVGPAPRRGAVQDGDAAQSRRTPLSLRATDPSPRRMAEAGREESDPALVDSHAAASRARGEDEMRDDNQRAGDPSIAGSTSAPSEDVGRTGKRPVLSSPDGLSTDGDASNYMAESSIAWPSGVSAPSYFFEQDEASPSSSVEPPAPAMRNPEGAGRGTREELSPPLAPPEPTVADDVWTERNKSDEGMEDGKTAPDERFNRRSLAGGKHGGPDDSTGVSAAFLAGSAVESVPEQKDQTMQPAGTASALWRNPLIPWVATGIGALLWGGILLSLWFLPSTDFVLLPTDTKVVFDGDVLSGSSPSIRYSRLKPHDITFSADGYRPETLHLDAGDALGRIFELNLVRLGSIQLVFPERPRAIEVNGQEYPPRKQLRLASLDPDQLYDIKITWNNGQISYLEKELEPGEYIEVPVKPE